MHIVFIIVYFGSFPNWLPLFLRSCGSNPDIHWSIYTDQTMPAMIPGNVSWIPMTFRECRCLFQERLGIPIRLETPKKLCDYKPAYGYIFEDELRDYDFWGYCDTDMVFGDIRSFLPADLNSMDKFGTVGNFTLFRNLPSVNRMFMSEISGIRQWEQVFTSDTIFAFDEWGKNTINDIFRQSAFVFEEAVFAADVWPERTPFYLSEYEERIERYHPVTESPCIFRWEAGHLWELSLYEGSLQEREIPAVHIQKRAFVMHESSESCCAVYILPGNILAVQSGYRHSEEEQLLKQGTGKTCLIDRQWLRIKLRNLRNRLENRL